MATSTAAIAVIAVATSLQRGARADSRMTLAVSTAAAGSATSATSGATGGGGASGSSSGACGSARPTAVLILSQTSARGWTEPTIWFNTPSRYSQARTIAVKSL